MKREDVIVDEYDPSGSSLTVTLTETLVGVASARARGRGGGGGAPRVELGLLAPVSKTEKRKVTSTPEVPGPSRSWNPAQRRC